MFVLNGFDQVSIDDVMKDAGLTRGAFYAHFKNKSALYEAAIDHARHETYKSVISSSTEPREQLNRYMSKEHVAGDELHCPLAFLVSDIQQRDDALKRAYTKGYTPNEGMMLLILDASPMIEIHLSF